MADSEKPEGDRPEPISKGTLTAVAGTLVTGTFPLVFPAIPLEAGVALWIMAGGIFLYAGRDWIRAWLPARWRQRRKPAPLEMPPIEDIHALINGDHDRQFQNDPIGDAFRRMANQPPPETWIPLDEAVRYLAKGSQWGVEQNQNDPHFSVKLGVQLRDALACGDLTSRGRKFHLLRGGIKDPPLHPLIPIPRNFWEQAFIDAYWPLQGRVQTIARSGVESAVKNGDNEGMHDIRLNQRQLETLWPPHIPDAAAMPNPQPRPPSLAPTPVATLQMEVTRASEKPQIQVLELVEDFDPGTGKKTIRLPVYNPSDQRVDGLVARLVEAKSRLEPAVGLPIVLTTKARIDRHRLSGEAIPVGPFNLRGYEKKQIELFRANAVGALEGRIIAEAGEFTFLLPHEELWVEVIGGGKPVRVGIRIEDADDGGWTTSLIVETVGEAHRRR